MNILAFDTCSPIMYIALKTGESTYDSRIIPTTEQSYNSAFLVSTIAEILKKNGLKVQDINAIGVNIGPGSFTGLRAAVTVGRIIAHQAGIPVAGISSFQLYSKLNPSEKKCLCIMDARRGMAYIGLYDKDSAEIMSPCIMEYDKALEIAQSEDFFIVSDDRMTTKLEERSLKFISFLESKEDLGIMLVDTVSSTLKNVSDRENFSWQKLKPLYIQSPSITVSKK